MRVLEHSPWLAKCVSRAPVSRFGIRDLFMFFQLSEGSLQELVGKFYRRTYVLLGFQQGFANWAEVEGWARETGTRFDAIHGPGCWLVIYECARAWVSVSLQTFVVLLCAMIQCWLTGACAALFCVV